MLDRIISGRTDLVFDYVAAGNPANATDTDGVSLIKWCAYFGDVSAIKFLLDAGAKIDAKDMNGDSPLTWASWYLRPDTISRKLCYRNFFIRPNRLGMFESITDAQEESEYSEDRC